MSKGQGFHIIESITRGVQQFFALGFGGEDLKMTPSHAAEIAKIASRLSLNEKVSFRDFSDICKEAIERNGDRVSRGAWASNTEEEIFSLSQDENEPIEDVIGRINRVALNVTKDSLVNRKP